jgi:hypothetical protein
MDPGFLWDGRGDCDWSVGGLLSISILCMLVLEALSSVVSPIYTFCGFAGSVLLLRLLLLLLLALLLGLVHIICSRNMIMSLVTLLLTAGAVEIPRQQQVSCPDSLQQEG